MARKPTISLYLRTYSDDPNTDWNATLDLARAMDAVGVDRVVVSDHLVFGENLDAYSDPAIGGTKGGRQPTGPDGHWMEPLVFLSAVAATTTRIRLGTAILLAALRRPAVLAKQLATMDVLSGGRVDLGVGVGWQREEYDAVGLSFEEPRTPPRPHVGGLPTLWTQQRAVYGSPELSFDGIHQMPKPVQPGGIPVWISGTVNKRVARRLSKFGTRWIPWGSDIVNLEESDSGNEAGDRRRRRRSEQPRGAGHGRVGERRRWRHRRRRFRRLGGPSRWPLEPPISASADHPRDLAQATEQLSQLVTAFATVRARPFLHQGRRLRLKLQPSCRIRQLTSMSAGKARTGC